MSPPLVLDPLLRHSGESDATIWVETGVEVEVLGHTARTFEVEGHHYALVRVTDLEPNRTYEYEVALGGERVWPGNDDGFPRPIVRTIASDRKLNLAFGSCQISRPHHPPYTLPTDEDGYESDDLYVLAQRMLREPRETWPEVFLCDVSQARTPVKGRSYESSYRRGHADWTRPQRRSLRHGLA